MSAPLSSLPQYYRSAYRKVAILGDGMMGSQIACAMANSRVEVLLYCTIPVESSKKDDYKKSLRKRISSFKPAALAHKSFLNDIKIYFLDDEDDLMELKNCDLIIEAIIEQLEEKKKLFKKIAPAVSDTAMLATNTSGLSIHSLSSVLPDKLTKRFLGIHFFNPVRYLSFCELIPSSASQIKELDTLRGFLTTILGKRVVIAKDSPAFIGNRLGLFSILATFQLAEKYALPADLVDELTGKLIGHASSATYRTADVVGLDVLKFVADNMNDNLKDDPWHSYFTLPDWVEKLIKEKKLGSKTKQGVYQKKADGIYVYDNGEYRKSEKRIDSKLKKMIVSNPGGIADALLEISRYNHPQAKFLWDLHRELFLYASYHLADYAYSLRSADIALKSGFGWQSGLFELWQKIGMKTVIDRIKQDIGSGSLTLTKTQIPQWVENVVAFYQKDGAIADDGVSLVPFESTGFALRLQRSPQYIQEQGINSNILFENEGIVAHEISERLVSIAHKTKMNVLSYDVIAGYHKVLDMMEQRGGAIVIHHLKEHFGAGANLAEMLVAVKTGRVRTAGTMSVIKSKLAKLADKRLPDVSKLPPLCDVISALQNLSMRIKHGPTPVVACVEGLALGGCCEILMHSTKVVAAINSYIGLVEIGVGLLPGGAGTKEMAMRAAQRQQGSPGMDHLATYASQILLAKVSGSAYEAREFGYLRDDDYIIANPDELFYTGCRVAESLLGSDYRPLPATTTFEVAGRDGYANILTRLENMHHGKFISDHDRHCAQTIANVICGGEIDAGEKVTSQWLLKLELDAFIDLIETEKTQERIEHILKTGKPLRN